MAFDSKGDETLESRLWDLIQTRSLGMLNLTKSGLHGQPVVALLDRSRKRLWLVTAADTELVRSIGEAGSAMFVVQGGDMLASIGGGVRIVDDRRRAERLWNSAAQAWYPEGVYDPRLVLLRMDCLDAEVSVSDMGVTRFAWEIAGAYGRRGPTVIGVGLSATVH